jgi:hypothetical protein
MSVSPPPPRRKNLWAALPLLLVCCCCCVASPVVCFSFSSSPPQPAAAARALASASLAAGMLFGIPTSPAIHPPAAHAEETAPTTSGKVINQLWAEPDSDLVRTLRERSEAKREERMAEMVRDYNERNFASYFDYSGQKLARKADGTYDLLSAKDYRTAEMSGLVDKGVYVKGPKSVKAEAPVAN